MCQNEILDEIRRVRDEYARAFDYDLEAIFADLRRRQFENGGNVVTLSSQHSQADRFPVSEAQKQALDARLERHQSSKGSI